MFNSKARRSAIERLERAVEIYDEVRLQVIDASGNLHRQRERVVSEVVTPVERYVNSLANTPKEFDKAIADFRIESTGLME